MDNDFHTLAFELLGWGDILPLPRMSGFEGDTYLTAGDYQILCNKVCRYVPGMTAEQWYKMSQEQRTVCMAEALAAMQSSADADDEWSEAKSPAEWEKILGISAATRLRYRKQGKLIVDEITTKSWRIHKSSLQQLLGSKARK